VVSRLNLFTSIPSSQPGFWYFNGYVEEMRAEALG
jgi:hypothetical protein